MITSTCTRILLLFFMIVVYLAISATFASAVLILDPTTYVNDANHLHAEWSGWDNETEDNWGNYNPAGWSVGVAFAGSPQTRWGVGIAFQHLVAPHPGDEAPGLPFSKGWSFANDLYGFIVSDSGNVEHPNNPHYDVWSFVFTRSMDPGNTKIVLDVRHAPDVGASFVLLCGALGALVPLTRRRQ